MLGGEDRTDGESTPGKAVAICDGYRYVAGTGIDVSPNDVP
jgi:hypothetical protein